MTRSLAAIAIAFLISILMVYTASARTHSSSRVESQRSSMARSCLADCVQRTGQIGRPAPVRACQIRCSAAADFVAETRGRNARPTAGAALPALPAAPNGYGVVYAANSPSSSFGMVVGNADRLSAYRLAEQRCAASGPGCRMIGEFTSVCGAVAQGIQRSRFALFMTSDPSTYVITSTSQGSADDRAGAESDAMAECGSKDRLGTCRIVAARCGSGS